MCECTHHLYEIIIVYLFLSIIIFITLLKLVKGEFNMLAMINRVKKCVTT